MHLSARTQIKILVNNNHLYTKIPHTFLDVYNSKTNNEVIVGYDFIQQFEFEFNANGYFFSDKTNQIHEDIELKCI